MIHARIRKPVLASGAMKMASIGLGIIQARLLLTLLGGQGYGNYSFFLSGTLLASAPIQNGITEVVVRETARGEASIDAVRVQRAWNWALKAMVTSVTIMACGMAAFGMLDTQASGYPWMALAAALMIFAHPSVSITGGALRGMGKVSLGQFPELVVKSALFVGLLMVFHGWDLQITGALALLANASAALVALLVAFFFLKQSAPGTLHLIGSRGSATKGLTRSGLTLGGVAMAQALRSQVGPLTLGIVGALDGVAEFRLAFLLSGLVSLSLMIVNPVIAPALAALIQKGQNAEAQRLLTRTSLILTTGALVLFSLLNMPGFDVAAMVFGQDVPVSGLVLLVLSAGQLANALCGPCGLVLNMAHEERVTLRGVLMAAVATVSLSVILGPRFGVLGVAAAVAAGDFLWNFILLREVRIRTQLDTSILCIIRPKLTGHG